MEEMPTALDLFKLSGKVALVTGGSKGLGLAMALGLAQAGADVAINSRHRDELDRAVAEIGEKTDTRVHGVTADLFSRRETVELAQQACAEMGRVDIIVNNAGTNIPAAADEIQDADWDRLIELNLSAPMALVRELAGQMKQRRWGRIINISSIFGLCTKEARGGYSAAKAGLIGLTRTMAQDLAPWGITANAIAPGPISTELTDRLVQGELRDYFDRMLVVGRWGKPQDLVGPLLLLASDAGSFITGATLPVDGGWMTR